MVRRGFALNNFGKKLAAELTGELKVNNTSKVLIVMNDGKLDITRSDVEPPTPGEPTEVSGAVVDLLSTTRILRGKLQRALELSPVRDAVRHHHRGAETRRSRTSDRGAQLVAGGSPVRGRRPPGEKRRTLRRRSANPFATDRRQPSRLERDRHDRRQRAAWFQAGARKNNAPRRPSAHSAHDEQRTPVRNSRQRVIDRHPLPKGESVDPLRRNRAQRQKIEERD